jgi:hypothetical protein
MMTIAAVFARTIKRQQNLPKFITPFNKTSSPHPSSPFPSPPWGEDR